MSMAADSDGGPRLASTKRVVRSKRHHASSRVCEEDTDLIQTVFTCHGNLEDPDFPQRFTYLLDQLSSILSKDKNGLMKRVKKVEPWNSVRVTLNIPREAAARLRTLAAAGDSALQALGILSVQLEGDQVISLRLAAQVGAEPQEIVLRTSNGSADAASAAVPSASSAGPVAALLQAIPGPSGSSSSGFKSPNVVAPATKSVIPPSPRPHSGPSPFPFTSMTHAAQTHARQDSPHHNFTPPPPPPPYASKPQPSLATRTLPSQLTPPVPAPAKPTPVVDSSTSLASPLLVNLLQTEGKDGKDVGASVSVGTASGTSKPSVRPMGPQVTTQRASTPRAAPPTPHVKAVVPAVVPPMPRPNFAANIDGLQPRVVLQGYSQFTAATSKPCTSIEKREVTDNANDMDRKKLIINPLTGELEPMPSESSDSDEDHASKEDPFFCQPSPSSRHSDDNSQEDVWLNSRRADASDDSDAEHGIKANGSEMTRRRTISGPPAPEKIKLRLMLDKPETGAAPAQAYKVDLSFSPAVRKSPSSGGRSVVAGSSPPTLATTASEELRVPPLHISLRGRNATVVSNKNKAVPWLLDKDQLYSKLPKKKTKLGSGTVKVGRDSNAITICDSPQTQKSKRTKLKRVLNSVDRLRVKMPYTSDVEETDLVDEKTSKKRKDSKKLKNNLRYSESDGEGTTNLKMDSEEWISRTLKEETLRLGTCLPGDMDGEEPEESVESAKSCSPVSAGVGDPRVPPIETIDGCLSGQEPSRTSALKPTNVELSELLFCKNLENNKKLDCLKGMNNIFTESEILAELVTSSEGSPVKKPQEIGGKIKSELSSKIDRVSGKLKNDLSKDGSTKRKLEESASKAVKSAIRSKCGKKELSTLRSAGGDAQGDDTNVNRAKRRHSGDLSAPESHAQKVKRSSSSDQPIPITKPVISPRRMDNLSRKIRKDYALDRLRKDKLGKTAFNAKLSPVNDVICKKAIVERLTLTSSNGAGKAGEDTPPITVLPSQVVSDSDKIKESAPVEGNTQGEDSGIESMDALSEKSPNQGESPCRKDDEVKKGQNHDRTGEEEGKEMLDNCLTLGNSNQITHPPQAHSVPFECSSRNNNSAKPQSEHLSTKLPEPVEDGLIDSFEIKIREAFRRDEDPTREGLAAKILEGSSKDWGKPPPGPELADKKSNIDNESTEKSDDKEWNKETSPCLEDMERFRVNPPLYTYAKREDSLSPSPTTVEAQHTENRNHIKEDESGSCNSASVTPECGSVKAEEHVEADSAATGRSLRNSKSLLEQLLIEIPEDTRRTRSWHKLGNSPGDTPKSSPRPASPSVARASPRAAKHSPNSRPTKRPTKRKCSENAAELIKACMGVDEGKSIKPTPTTAAVNWNKGDVESSDDEPLSDLARSREQSVELDAKPSVLKNKVKQIIEEENRNNNKVGVKVATEAPTRRSGRQTQGLTKALRTDGRSVRSTRSAPCQEPCDTGNKRRRTSRDGK